MSKIRIAAIVIASCGIIVALFMLLKTASDYKKAENEYDKLAQYATSTTDESGKGSGTIPDGGLSGALANADGSEIVESEVAELKRNYDRELFPDIEVDFAGLSAINPSVVAWLYVEGASINYPVVQCDDNEFYLHHTFEMKKNSSGCVFMDYEVDPNLTSWNTFIYGHNMKNGTMFGHLKNYINNKNVYDRDPYIYIFRPDGIYRYEIFSYYLDTVDSKMYYTCDNFREYRAYLREATAKSVRECTAKATPDQNIVTLVTCSGSGANKQRFFVHGVFVDRYLYE